MNSKIEQLVIDASYKPLDPKKNFDIAFEYEKLGQTASAVSFYLRAAEYGYNSDPDIVYASLLRISLCIENQNDRMNTVGNVISQAIAYAPDRPEAYLLYSRFYEKNGMYQNSYMFAKIGLQFARMLPALPVSVGYPGSFALDFQIAVSAWWIGRKDESITIFNTLKQKDLPKEYMDAINSNLERINNVDV